MFLGTRHAQVALVEVHGRIDGYHEVEDARGSEVRNSLACLDSLLGQLWTQSAKL